MDDGRSKNTFYNPWQWCYQLINACKSLGIANNIYLSCKVKVIFGSYYMMTWKKPCI